jgi:hypothetical protein
MGRRSVHSHTAPPSLSKDAWISVLHLTVMWQMPLLREAAITQLDELVTDSIEKLRLADTYDVPAWSIPALLDLVNREATLTEADVNSIGLQRSLKVVALRERRFRSSSPKCDQCDVLGVLRYDCACRGREYVNREYMGFKVLPGEDNVYQDLPVEDVRQEFGL